MPVTQKHNEYNMKWKITNNSESNKPIKVRNKSSHIELCTLGRSYDFITPTWSMKSRLTFNARYLWRNLKINYNIGSH